MKKIYEIHCYTNDWENEEAEELTFKLEEKMYDYFFNKKEALDYFVGRFNFLKDNWLKKWIEEVARDNPNITIGAELYEAKVPNNYDTAIENCFDYNNKVIKTLYFCEGAE